MKTKMLGLLGALGMAITTTAACAQEQTMANKKASYIEMTAADGQTENFAQFLAGAAPLVKKNEPGTELWFALQAQDLKLAIFDIFVDEAARDAHFSGVVAAALKENAGKFVDGGWEEGVVANIENSSVLSAKAPVVTETATIATYIKIKAAPGQGDALAELLAAAGPIVAETEPKTLYWVALQLDDQNFAIFDIFADESGRQAHFEGKVANLLKEHSSDIVEGGWENGVAANISNYEILAIN